MKTFFYGNDDNTGMPCRCGSLIIFAESQSEADAIAISIFGNEWHENLRLNAGLEIERGMVISAASYYGVGFEQILGRAAP